MSDNKHHAYAEAAFSSANAGAEPEFNEAVRADALIQATLALAYEQHTANLIAFYQSVPLPRVGEDVQLLRGQIIERLGLS